MSSAKKLYPRLSGRVTAAAIDSTGLYVPSQAAETVILNPTPANMHLTMSNLSEVNHVD